MVDGVASFQWLGATRPYLDSPVSVSNGQVVIGTYGGATAADASKNEDGAVVWRSVDGGWEFAALLDAHDSSQSSALVLETLVANQVALCDALAAPVESAFNVLHLRLLTIFQSPAFRDRCHHIQGETACLICVRKEQFVWWLSIGDCSLYLLHPELARLGQYALNQRNFYEWVGAVNTFDLAVPCYSSGVRELRAGRSVIVMTTDGLLEYPDSPFPNPQTFYVSFTAPDQSLDAAVGMALQHVHTAHGRDSATLIAWAYENTIAGREPSS